MTYQYDLLREGSGAFTQGVAGETLVDRDLVYLNASGLWVKADASSYNTVPVVGLTLGALTTGKRGRILLEGFVGHSSWGWTPGTPLYASETSGVITATAPETARQTVGRAVENDLIYFKREPVQNIIYWTQTIRELWCLNRDVHCIQQLAGTEWFALEINPGQGKTEYFLGVFDVTGLGIPVILGLNPWYAVKVGAGTFTANNGVNEGMRVTTGATTNDSNIFATGDNTGPKYVWNQAAQPHIHFKFKFPGVKTNMKVSIQCYEDANNYFGLRYDTSADANLHFITKDGVGAGNEEDTDLGAPDANWHDVYMKMPLDDSVAFYYGGNYTHTTHVPDGNLTFYCLVETLDNVAKSLDITDISINQTPI